MKFNWIFALLFMSSVVASAQQNLSPVPAESKVHFDIKNFGFNVGGDFGGLKGQVVFDKTNPSASSFDITVDATSIDTDNSRRDGHLRDVDYFDVTKYPTIRIVGNAILNSDKTYQFKGNLTIKNTTKPIEFPFTVSAKDAGLLFEGAFEIDRLHFTVGKESTVMSDKVKVTLKVLAK